MYHGYSGHYIQDRGDNMDPIIINEIINKKPKSVVTADEWNYILTLLVEQGNQLSRDYVSINNTLQSILKGEVPSITVNTNVTSFGGHTVDEFTLDTELNTAISALEARTNTKLNSKMDAGKLAYNRTLISDGSGNVQASSVTSSELTALTGATSNIQRALDLLNGDMTRVTNTANSITSGKKIWIQQAQPSNPSNGDVWIGW